MRDHGSYRRPAGAPPPERKRTIDADGLDERAYEARRLRKQAEEATRERLAREQVGLKTERRPPPTPAEKLSGATMLAGMYSPLLLSWVAENAATPVAVCTLIVLGESVLLHWIAHEVGIDRLRDLSRAEWGTLLLMTFLGLGIGVAMVVVTARPSADALPR